MFWEPPGVLSDSHLSTRGFEPQGSKRPCRTPPAPWTRRRTPCVRSFKFYTVEEWRDGELVLCQPTRERIDVVEEVLEDDDDDDDEMGDWDGVADEAGNTLEDILAGGWRRCGARGILWQEVPGQGHARRPRAVRGVTQASSRRCGRPGWPPGCTSGTPGVKGAPVGESLQGQAGWGNGPPQCALQGCV